MHRLPWPPHAEPTSGSVHAQMLSCLVRETYPVATPPRPPPAAAAAAAAAPSPLPPKIAVRVGQGAKGLSVLLALLLERRAPPAAGCRAAQDSMTERSRVSGESTLPPSLPTCAIAGDGVTLLGTKSREASNQVHPDLKPHPTS